MGFKVIWTETALADLAEICAHIAADNPSAADRMGLEILDHVEIRATFPLIGPNYPRGSHGTLREIVVRPYRIFYDTFEDRSSVEILHVWHGAREEPKFHNQVP
ncbi:MAG: type II toxin-antitoxin system RelE/ParE family toxin [Pedosphaera sp.]|nr:type II toxin-antitoxin system RelE/ParE family toxin [Pedosphaera sp.]